jgi:hypothetical protein
LQGNASARAATARGVPDNPARDHFREGRLGLKFTPLGYRRFSKTMRVYKSAQQLAASFFPSSGPRRSAISPPRRFAILEIGIGPFRDQ